MRNTIIILSLLALVAATVACTTQAQEVAQEEPVASVKAAQAEAVQYRPTVYATGILASAEEAKLSFKTGGIIARIHVREGQKVRKGQLLAELQMDEIQAQAEQASLGEDQAQIDLDNARLALQLAERDYRNVQGLYADSVATLEQLENVEVQLNNAKNQLAAAEKGLAYRAQGVEVAQFNVRYSKIVAPTDGIILRQFAEVNELVGPGSPVFYFGSQRQSQVLKVSITDKDIVHLNLGDTARLQFDAYPGTVFLGFVRELAGTAAPRTGTFPIEIELAPAEQQLMNGFIGSAMIQTSRREDLIAIPVDGLLRADQQQGEVMVVENGRTLKRQVHIHHLEQEQLLLRSGLQADEVIIVAGAGYLEEGDSVKPVFQ